MPCGSAPELWSEIFFIRFIIMAVSLSDSRAISAKPSFNKVFSSGI